MPAQSSSAGVCPGLGRAKAHSSQGRVDTHEVRNKRRRLGLENPSDFLLEGCEHASLAATPDDLPARGGAKAVMMSSGVETLSEEEEVAAMVDASPDAAPHSDLGCDSQSPSSLEGSLQLHQITTVDGDVQSVVIDLAPGDGDMLVEVPAPMDSLLSLSAGCGDPHTQVQAQPRESDPDGYAEVSSRRAGSHPQDQAHPRTPGSVGKVKTPTRRALLLFPKDTTKTLPEKHRWFLQLLRGHPEANPLFKEGRNLPYITVDVGDVCDKLVTQGYCGQKLVLGEEQIQTTVIIHNVPTYVDPDDLELPPDFLWLKRRHVGRMTRPQLLGAVLGTPPGEVHLFGVGRKRVERYVPEPDLCKKCSRWGHKEWRCNAAPRCRYCAGRHLSDVCRDQILRGIRVPPRCCNCGGPHNANSHVCPSKPSIHRPQGQSGSHPSAMPRYLPAPLPSHNAWGAQASPISAGTPPIGTNHFPPLPNSQVPPVASAPPVGVMVAPSGGPSIIDTLDKLRVGLDSLTATVTVFDERLRSLETSMATITTAQATVNEKLNKLKECTASLPQHEDHMATSAMPGPSTPQIGGPFPQLQELMDMMGSLTAQFQGTLGRIAAMEAAMEAMRTLVHHG